MAEIHEIFANTEDAAEYLSDAVSAHDRTLDEWTAYKALFDELRAIERQVSTLRARHPEMAEVERQELAGLDEWQDMADAASY